jgi:hypothetical protein
MSMSKDERETLVKTTKPRAYVLTANQAAALLTAADFVLDNGGPEEEVLEHLRNAVKILEG